MVCPGTREPSTRRRSAFDDHRTEWEAVAQRGDQEFANHSAHHRRATGDEDMEREIGEASKANSKGNRTKRSDHSRIPLRRRQSHSLPSSPNHY
jgi:hypothetical protein